ncbi:MAG: ABC transporter permease [Candidatus Yanofskybacteria bacterium]|nr:ABC transporter permease [Candidatus Yanofskybacteria bacterium]
MNTTLQLTKDSLRMFIRNKQAAFFTLVFPLITMTIFGLIGFDRPTKFDIGLINHNPQGQTQQFVEQIKKIEVFSITEGSLDEEMDALKKGDRIAVLDVPGNFMELDPSQPKELKVYINESKQAQAQATVSILSQYLDKTSLQVAHVPTFFNIKQETVNSRNLKYLDFLLPGLIAMSIMQMSVFSVAFVFVQFKEKGVLKRLVATPMLPSQFVAANVVTRLIVSVIQTAIFIAAGVFILKAHVTGSYLLVLLSVVLGALMFLGLGFSLSGLAKTVETVPVFANLLVFPMLFLGGVFFPISSMPNWLQKVANVLPLTFFSDAMRKVMTEAAGIGAIKWDLLFMALWGAVLITIATFTFRFQEREAG